MKGFGWKWVPWLTAVSLFIGLAWGVQADAAVEVKTPPLEMKPENYDVPPVPFGS